MKFDKVYRIAHVVGARPNFIKAAPLVREFKKYEKHIDQQIYHTGQHYDDELSRQVLLDVNLTVTDYINCPKGFSLGNTIDELKNRFSLGHGYDLVIVYGDVNSTVAAALAANQCGTKVVHVESGLRSFDRSMPEEINRILVDNIADFLFVSEESGIRNLINEKIGASRFFYVGNIMIDSLKLLKEKYHYVTKNDQILLTLHRPSNVDDLESFNELVKDLDSLGQNIIFPVHPRSKPQIQGLDLKNIELVPPMSYNKFIKEMMSSKAIITDSGGIQEETTYLGIPCLTLRQNTERPSTIAQGTNTLIYKDYVKRIQRELEKIDKGEYKKGSIPDLWDGYTSKRIVDIILKKISS